MKGLGGYGRYDDDDTYVGCPRAKSDMTPCMARDGELALQDREPGQVDRCIGCGGNPVELLSELLNTIRRQPVEDWPPMSQAAYWLKTLVWNVTQPERLNPLALDEETLDEMLDKVYPPDES